MKEKQRVNFWNPIRLTFQVGMLMFKGGRWVIKTAFGKIFAADKVKYKEF